MRLSAALSPGPDVNVVVGPEGDFSTDEYATLRDAGATFISLGDGIYRSEVAAAHLAALVMYELGRLG